MGRAWTACCRYSVVARCGRCGLWNKYPADNYEKRYAGVCIWYQIKLLDSDVFEQRDCGDFFERIPGWHSMDHFDYKVKRDNLGDAYHAAIGARRFSYVGIVLSSLSLVIALIKILK